MLSHTPKEQKPVGFFQTYLSQRLAQSAHTHACTRTHTHTHSLSRQLSLPCTRVGRYPAGPHLSARRNLHSQIPLLTSPGTRDNDKGLVMQSFYRLLEQSL